MSKKSDYHKYIQITPEQKTAAWEGVKSYINLLPQTQYKQTLQKLSATQAFRKEMVGAFLEIQYLQASVAFSIQKGLNPRPMVLIVVKEGQSDKAYVQDLKLYLIDNMTDSRYLPILKQLTGLDDAGLKACVQSFLDFKRDYLNLHEEKA